MFKISSVVKNSDLDTQLNSLTVRQDLFYMVDDTIRTFYVVRFTNAVIYHLSALSLLFLSLSSLLDALRNLILFVQSVEAGPWLRNINNWSYDLTLVFPPAFIGLKLITGITTPSKWKKKSTQASLLRKNAKFKKTPSNPVFRLRSNRLLISFL